MAEATKKQVLKKGWGVPEGRLRLGIQGCGDSVCNSPEERKGMVVTETTQFDLACIVLIFLLVPLGQRSLF